MLYVITDAYGNGSINNAAGVNNLKGPFNDYSALGSIMFEPGTTLQVSSLIPSAPITLNNVFTFTSSANDVTLILQTGAIITDSTVKGFNYVTGGNLVLNIQTINGVPITGSDNAAINLNNNWVDNTNSNTPLSKLTLMTPATISNITAQKIGYNANSSSYYSTTGGIYVDNTSLTIKPKLDPNNTLGHNANNYLTYSITPQNPNANLIIDSSLASGDMYLTFLQNVNNSSNYSSYGNLVLNAAGGNQINFSPNGNNVSKPLNTFTISGSSSVNTDAAIGTSNITLDTNSPFNLAPVLLSNGGSIKLNQNTAVGSHITVAGFIGSNSYNPTAVNTTINLGSYTFNASNSSLNFSGNLNINTQLVSTNAGINHGHFVMNTAGSSGSVAGGGSSSPITLDTSTNLTINITQPQGYIPANQYTLPIFVTTDGTNNSTLSPLPNNATVNVMPNSIAIQNGTVSWHYSAGAIVANVNLSNITNNISASPNAIALVNTLVQNSLKDATTSATSVSSNTMKIVEAIASSRDPNTAAQVMNRLVPQATTQAATLESIGLATERVANQSVSGAVIEGIVDIMPKTSADSIDSFGAAAGDALNHGAWASGFAQKAIQKSYSNTVGYKVQTTGGTFGSDTKVNDTLTLGAAWTTTHGIVKHRDSLSGNKANVINNIFTLYGVNTFNNNWIVNGSLSGGFARTKSRLEQRIGVIPIYGSSKQKSKTYAVNLQAVKLIAAGTNIVLQPTIGVSYNQFNDNGYTQSGTVVEQTIAARKSYNWEGLLGAKALGIYNYNDYIIKPSLSAYAHITIKDKQGKIHTSLDATTGQVPVDQSKASAAWYSTGTGLAVTKGAWEAGISYEFQLDKKYAGHLGTLRLRIEF